MHRRKLMVVVAVAALFGGMSAAWAIENPKPVGAQAFLGPTVLGPNYKVKPQVRSDQPPIAAGTLPELAEKLGIGAGELAATVEAYNAACPTGTFKPLELDALATKPGYAPRKTNWARPLDKPPFLAFPIICGNCFTFGGLKVDTHARVINADGEPIPGLYAAGETMGLYYGTYPGATSVLRGAVFGRIAGAHAAARSS